MVDVDEGLSYGKVILASGEIFPLTPQSFNELREVLLNPSFSDDRGYISLVTKDGCDLVIWVEGVTSCLLSTPESRRKNFEIQKRMEQEENQFRASSSYPSVH